MFLYVSEDWFCAMSLNHQMFRNVWLVEIVDNMYTYFRFSLYSCVCKQSLCGTAFALCCNIFIKLLLAVVLKYCIAEVVLCHCCVSSSWRSALVNALVWRHSGLGTIFSIKFGGGLGMHFVISMALDSTMSHKIGATDFSIKGCIILCCTVGQYGTEEYLKMDIWRRGGEYLD